MEQQKSGHGQNWKETWNSESITSTLYNTPKVDIIGLTLQMNQ